MNMMRRNLFSLIFLIYSVSATASAEDDHHWIVQTNSGPVEGTTVTTFSGKDVYVFYGIPYAEPPIGSLRFQPPTPVTPWTNVLQATKKPMPCYQTYTTKGVNKARLEGKLIQRPWSEDCLTLTLWVPKPKITDAPVLILFHSGNFRTGSGIFPSTDGGTLSAHALDVVVSMNYRLGAFGFLDLAMPTVSGNAGLLDQQLALKWVHENVHHFGGKKDAIILSGVGGVGSASAGFQFISPGSAGLFKTVVFIGGAPNCNWVFNNKDKSLQKSKSFASNLGCNSTNVDDELDCLRRAHPEDIVDASRPDKILGALHFKPTVDGEFLKESPREALQAGRFNKAAVLALTNAHENSLFLHSQNPDVMSQPEKGFDIEGFRIVMKRLIPSLNQASMSAIEDYYIGDCSTDDHVMIRDAAIRAYSDASIDCCVNEFCELVTQNGGVVFRCIDDLKKESLPDWVGSAHGFSGYYALGYPMAEEKFGYTKTEANMSLFFMDWINDHTRRKAEDMTEDVPLFNMKDKPYVYWDAVGPTYHNRYREQHCHLFQEIIPKLQKDKNACTPS